MTQETAPARGNVDVGLLGVPETMLWTLHNRQYGASDTTKDWFQDDKCLEIYRAIDYDYEKSFGKANDSHVLRSYVFDRGVRDFWKEHPGGTVVNFAEGLETQRFRVEDARPEDSLYISVDLPPAIAAREKFIQPDSHHLHVAASAIDFDAWVPLVPKDRPVFFTAQGLLMYFEEEDVKTLFRGLAKNFPASHLWFDSIAKWASNLTMRPTGVKLTKDYKVPPLPFGVNIDKAEGLFQSWVPDVKVDEIDWPMWKADKWFFYRYVVPVFKVTPFVKNLQPGMAFDITFPESSPSLN